MAATLPPCPISAQNLQTGSNQDWELEASATRLGTATPLGQGEYRQCYAAFRSDGSQWILQRQSQHEQQHGYFDSDLSWTQL
jgi:hypothetical protein